MSSASRDRGIDYSPVGALSAGGDTFGASAFRVLEASPESTLIRGPRGEILRVMKGDILAGVGRIDAIVRRRGRWAVVTAGASSSKDRLYRGRIRSGARFFSKI